MDPYLSKFEEIEKVFGSDGSQIGIVAEQVNDYLVVEKGFLFPTYYQVPLTLIDRTRSEHGKGVPVGHQ